MNNENILADVHDYLDSCDDNLDTAPWLNSIFQSPTWSCSFESSRNTTINWDILLYNNTRLTDTKNNQLLISFKHWLIAATETPITLNARAGGVYAIYLMIIHLINYLILNGIRLNIADDGLSALSSSEIRYIIDRVTSLTLSEALYDFKNNLQIYLNNLQAKTDKFLLKRIIRLTPEIRNLDDNQRTLLKNSDFFSDYDSLITTRALLLINGFYYRSTKSITGYRKAVIALRLIEYIFPNCIKFPIFKKMPLITLLAFSPRPNYNREIPAAPITLKSNQPYLDEDRYYSFRSAFLSLDDLRYLNIQIPTESSLSMLSKLQPDLALGGRYRTLPSDGLFYAVKNAIEFHIKYGKEIIDSFISLANSGLDSLHTMPDRQFCELLNPLMSRIGVKS